MIGVARLFWKSLLDACWAMVILPSVTLTSSSAAGLPPVPRASALFWNSRR